MYRICKNYWFQENEFSRLYGGLYCSMRLQKGRMVFRIPEEHCTLVTAEVVRIMINRNFITIMDKSGDFYRTEIVMRSGFPFRHLWNVMCDHLEQLYGYLTGNQSKNQEDLEMKLKVTELYLNRGVKGVFSGKIPEYEGKECTARIRNERLHCMFSDKSVIRTSRVVQIRELVEGILLVTESGSIYRILPVK